MHFQVPRARQWADTAVTFDARARPSHPWLDFLAPEVVVLPPHGPGMSIGLLGGSFNPPHEAHRAVSVLAMKRIGLDRVWWLVTPGNPLKDTVELPPLCDRIRAARRLASHPRIDVTGFEAAIKTRYTIDTLTWLITHCSSTRFVWIMGADNLGEFHRWRKWRQIADLVPIAVVDRGGTSPAAKASPAALALADDRIPESAASSLPRRKPPAWVFLHGLKSNVSSTRLRALRSPPRAG